MNKHLLSLFVLLILFLNSLGQEVYNNPIASKQSHPELEITKIIVTDTSTVVSLKVTNKRSQGGWFCANDDIYLKNPKGTEKYQLVRAENIPTCPDQFEFSYSGQTLEFNLYFPSLPNQFKFIDLIENCSNACFSFYGIILDNRHNKKIRAFEKGFDLYQNKQLSEAIHYFEEVLSGGISIESNIYGLSYYYLILIYKEAGNTDKVNFWHLKLLNSTLEEKATIIKELEKFGLKKQPE